MKYLLIIFILLSSAQLVAQEICNNGLDDDNDGFIDLNDTDCFCEGLVPASLIPNPSFEEMSCCPTTEGDLDCANDWIQASEPTTDYVHTCGVLANPFLPYNGAAPLPFPDGEGGVGFRDGKSGNANYKEYAGACLLESMNIGVEYTLDFFVGFHDQPGSTTFPMALFATTECGNLPFGINNIQFGCPTNGPGWTQLGEFSASGVNEWVNVVFTFTPTQEYTAIALGPACQPHPEFDLHPYFYFDRLLLFESSAIGIPFSNITGGICTNDLSLEVEGNDQYTYQWYKDGIAIVGETNSTIELAESSDVEGVYSVLIDTDQNACFTSQEFLLEIPEYEGSFEGSFCEGEIYEWNDESYDAPGLYDQMLIASDGCDSMVTLNLIELKHSAFGFEDVICEGTPYELYDINTELGGVFETTIMNSVGCDSLITVSLELVESNEGIELGMDEEINLGDEIDIIPVWYDPNMVNFVWTNNNNVILGEESSLEDLLLLESTTFYVYGEDENGCIALDTIDVRVDRNIDIFIPNIFTPNRDGANDFFGLFGNPAVQSIKDLYIYDRWGELVHEDHDQLLRTYRGWDGKFKSEDVVPGVYAYLVTFTIIDGTEEVFSGDVTVLR